MTEARDDQSEAVKRFNQLPSPVRRLLADLDSDDVATLKRIIALHRAMAGWCRINRWLFLTIVAVLVALSQGYEAIAKLLARWMH